MNGYDNLKAYNVFFLFGGLGVGKTSFVRHFLNNPEVTSPTFCLCNQYDNNTYHFDLYNLKNIEEDLVELNFLNIINNKENKVFVEWSEKITDPMWKYFTANYIKLEFDNFQPKPIKI